MNELSFAWQVKNELCQNKLLRRQGHLQALGLLRFAGRFDAHGMELETEHKGVARLYCEHITAAVALCGSLTLLTRGRAGRLHYKASVDDAADRAALLQAFAEPLLQHQEHAQAGALLSGCFMACGSMADPNKSYRLEFAPPAPLLEELVQLLEGLGFTPLRTSRRGEPVVYFKESEQVEDLLTLMGASRASLQVMNIKVEKSLRNRVNRANNCDVANLDKTLAAAARQIAAIRQLEADGRLESLPPPLQTLAHLRCQNPELSLSELGGLFRPPLSRSAVNRRLGQLVALVGDTESQDT